MHLSTLTAALASAAAFTLTEAASKKASRTFGTLSFGGGKELSRCRLDPIVNPGGVASHMHSIFGGNAFSDSMPGDAAEKASCTTANVKNDHSNYWVPTLYFKSPENGTLYPVELFYAKVYYFFEATNDDIKPFPKGFRMLAGDASLRSPPNPAKNNLDPSKGTVTPVQWTCPRSSQDSNTPLYPPSSDGTAGVGVQDPSNGGQGWGFPDKECNGFASPLRADIHFPSCYNPNVSPENYKENNAYPSSNGMGGQDCPPGWVHVPHIFMEVYWNTLKFHDMWKQGQGYQPWVLANGDETGYSLHADFINGWDTKTLAYLIDNCDPGHAGLASCPGLPGGQTSEEEMKSCKLSCPLPEGSDVFGQPLPDNKLFGHNDLSGYQAGPYVAAGGSSPSKAQPPAAPRPVAAQNSAPVNADITDAQPTGASSPSASAYPSPAPTSVPEADPVGEPQGQAHEHTKYATSVRLHTVVKTITVDAGTPIVVAAAAKTAAAKKACRTRRPSRKSHRHHRAGGY
ncbi:hypothetical protein DRE_02592 [Drechslerella stenobrocha 248]|uniref:DUF1996 domain-containing protein n=1 Tax=Drechslerella stenobrocha 248 TaxID=1043628 RepID=W7I6X1_9PEZI|nr:hypothetical protein DRE_02592 [Drechslerella stenobrocha 248]